MTARARIASLGLVLVCVWGCDARVRGVDSRGGEAAGASEGEAPPAPPCSINGMLVRDTDAPGFHRCGRAEPPLQGEAMRCVQDSMRMKRPFVLELGGGPTLAPGHQPALIGADFGEGFALRSYLSTGSGSGERVEVELVMRSAQDPGLSLMPRLERNATCIMEAGGPASEGSGWRSAGPHRWVRAGGCAERFDRKAWEAQPWALRFDPERRLLCQGPG